MMRITPIILGSKPELAEQEAKIIRERGRISELYQVLLNSPSIAHGWEQMLSAVRNRSSLSASVRELVILRVAVLNRASYEFNAHVPHALAAGVSPATIDAVQEAPYLTKLSTDASLKAAERIALTLTDTMTRAIEVPDVIYNQVREHFDAQAQIDLVATIAAYNMVSRFLTALHIGH